MPYFLLQLHVNSLKYYCPVMVFQHNMQHTDLQVHVYLLNVEFLRVFVNV